MATKKIQNFVKSKVSVHSNISKIPFSKQIRFKGGDSQEEPLIFQTIDSDREDDDEIDQKCENIGGGQINYAGNSNNSNNDEFINNYSNEIDNKQPNDDYEVLEEEIDDENGAQSSASSNNTMALRARVGSIGKSVNSAFKDAHSALNAIMKDSALRKKGLIRKPSEITKGKRFGSFGKRKVAAAMAAAAYKVEEEEGEEGEEDEGGDVEQVEQVESVTEVAVNEEEHVVEKVEVEGNQEGLLREGVVEEEENVDDCNLNNIESVQPVNFNNLKLFGAIGVFIMMFFLFSISKFILGLLCGILMSFGIFKIYESFFFSINDSPVINQKYPHLRELVSPLIPHIEETDMVDEYASSKASFSSWVNAVNSYHPSWYNIAASYSLHISLEGTKLRMRKPKGKVPTRMIWNESKLSGITLISERTVELLHAKVHLLPYGLVRRRMWSKKYPICITITKNANEKTDKLPINISKPLDPSSPELNLNEENFFFFTRTCREKEEMFRRLMAASLGMPITLTISDIVDIYLSKEVFSSQAVPLTHVHDIKDGGESTSKNKDDGSISRQRNILTKTPNVKEPQIVTYVRYMAKFMPSDMLLLKAKSHHIDLNYISCESELLWLNALFGRLAWEVFRGGHWIKVIREKIERKLKKLHLPYFIDKLEVIDIDLGAELPVVKKVSRPYLDYKGLWVEFEVEYAGGFSMGLETKMNLMKLKNVASQQKSGSNKSQKSECTVKYVSETDSAQADNLNVHNNDIQAEVSSNDINLETKLVINMATGGGAVITEEDDDKTNLSSDDSFASSSDSELSGDKFDSEDSPKPQSLSHTSSNKSFLQWVDKIARSSYFQKAADNKYVLRTMEYVSNTSLQLQVDAQYLSGTLVINIPPPPSDRLWWGFKKSPQLNIKARPKVGQKEIQMTKLVEFIEKKLVQEFHRAAVLPNMDDIAIPMLLNGNPEKYSQTLL